MELRVKRGRGYVSADRNFDEDLGIGWIPIDSVHSPVKKVNYLVEGARIGQTTDYDKLTIEVWTNGSVTPRDAVSLSAKLIRDHLNIFVNLDEADDDRPKRARKPARAGVTNEHLDKSVEELELSVRSYNCLKNANIRTIRELVRQDRNRNAQDQEFRAQVAQRDQGDPDVDGAEPRHEARPARDGGIRQPCVIEMHIASSAGTRRIASRCCGTRPRPCFATSGSKPPFPRPRNCGRTSSG